MNTIGFVGVGRMGSNMARHLNEKGYNIGAVYDVRTESATELGAELGVPAPKRLAEVSALSDVVITVVTDDAAMRSIFGLNGEADHLLVNAAGKIFVNCATISPEVHVEVENSARAAGAQSLEACMASSITQARRGTLYLMVGGEEAVFKKVEPILRDMSMALRHVGRTGEAAKVKALVNMVMNINTAGLAEGLGLADALGLDLTRCARFFPRLERIRACWRPMVKICKIVSTRVFFPQRMPPKTPASLWVSPAPRDLTSHWRRRPKPNTIAWSLRALENSTNPASPN